MQINALSAVSLSAPANLPTVPRKSGPAPSTVRAGAPTTINPIAPAPSDLQGAIYTTRIAGKNYSGDIAYRSGVYTISVPSLPGVDGRGSSLFAAENALNARIDIFA